MRLHRFAILAAALSIGFFPVAVMARDTGPTVSTVGNPVANNITAYFGLDRIDTVAYVTNGTNRDVLPRLIGVRSAGLACFDDGQGAPLPARRIAYSRTSRHFDPG